MRNDDLNTLTAMLLVAIVLVLLYNFKVFGAEPQPKCEDVLSACDKDVEKLKAQVTGLKEDVRFWKKSQTEVKTFGCVTAITLGATSGALGGVAANGKTGLAPGGIVGTLVGVAGCLLVQ